MGFPVSSHPRSTFLRTEAFDLCHVERCFYYFFFFFLGEGKSKSGNWSRDVVTIHFRQFRICNTQRRLCHKKKKKKKSSNFYLCLPLGNFVAIFSTRNANKLKFYTRLRLDFFSETHYLIAPAKVPPPPSNY